ELLLEPVLLECPRERAHEVVGRGEEHAPAGLAGLEAEADREHGLAGPRRADQDHVLAVLEEAQRPEVAHEPAVDRGLEVEVELLERLLVRGGRKALEQLDLALAALLEFDLEEARAEVQVAGLLPGAGLSDPVDHPGDPREREGSQLLLTTLALERPRHVGRPRAHRATSVSMGAGAPTATCSETERSRISTSTSGSAHAGAVAVRADRSGVAVGAGFASVRCQRPA